MINLLRRVTAAWNQFWFAPEDPWMLSLMRCFAGGMLWYTHFVWGLDFQAFFGNVDSWQSREFVQALQEDQWAWSFWWWIPESWMWSTHLVCMAILTAFWFGLATKVTGWLAFLITISYAQRVPLATYGLDQVNAITVLYLAMAPCGAYFSVDAWLRDHLSSGPHRSWWSRLGSSVAPTPAVRLATRLIQVHVCVIYLWAGLGKLQGETWWNGEAIWYSAASLEYQSNDMTWIAYFPLLYQALSIATWSWEVFFPVLIWRDTLRPWLLLAGIGMHLGIGLFMGMWTFGLAMIFTYFAFISPEEGRALVCRAREWLHRPRGQVFTAVRDASPSREPQVP